MTGLDIQIHRVFAAVEAATEDEEAAQTLELMEGIVILSGIVHTIAEARLGTEAPDPVSTVFGTEGNFTILGGVFNPGERVIITIAHTATAAVYIEGSLLNEQFAANETGAFQAAGILPLGAGVFTLEATARTRACRLWRRPWLSTETNRSPALPLNRCIRRSV